MSQQQGVEDFCLDEDAHNDETFGGEPMRASDWERQHERFVAHFEQEHSQIKASAASSPPAALESNAPPAGNAHSFAEEFDKVKAIWDSDASPPSEAPTAPPSLPQFGGPSLCMGPEFSFFSGADEAHAGRLGLLDAALPGQPLRLPSPMVATTPDTSFVPPSPAAATGSLTGLPPDPSLLAAVAEDSGDVPIGAGLGGHAARVVGATVPANAPDASGLPPPLAAAVASGTLTLAQAQALFTQTACASAAASATSTGPSASPPPGMSKAPPPGMASLVPQFLPPPGLPPPATATGATPASAAVLTPVSAPTAAHTPLVAPAATNAPPLLQPAPPPPLSFAQYLAATAALQQKQKTLQQQLQVQQQQQQQSVSPPSAPQPPQQGTGLRIGPGVFLPPGLALPPGLVLPAASGFGAANASAPIPGAVPHMAPPPIGAGAVAQQLAAMQLGSPQVPPQVLARSPSLLADPARKLRCGAPAPPDPAEDATPRSLMTAWEAEQIARATAQISCTYDEDYYYVSAVLTQRLPDLPPPPVAILPSICQFRTHMTAQLVVPHVPAGVPSAPSPLADQAILGRPPVYNYIKTPRPAIQLESEKIMRPLSSVLGKAGTSAITSLTASSAPVAPDHGLPSLTGIAMDGVDGGDGSAPVQGALPLNWLTAVYMLPRTPFTVGAALEEAADCLVDLVDIDRCLFRAQGNLSQQQQLLLERQTLALRAVCVLCVPLHPSQKKASPAALIVGASPLTLARDAQEAMFARCMRRSESGSPIKFHWPTRTSTLASAKGRTLLARLLPLLPADLAAAVALCVVRTIPDSLLHGITPDALRGAARLARAITQVLRTLPLPAVTTLLRSLSACLNANGLTACLQSEACLPILHMLIERGSTLASKLPLTTDAAPPGAAAAPRAEWDVLFGQIVQRLFVPEEVATAGEAPPSPPLPPPSPTQACFARAVSASSEPCDHLWGLAGFVALVAQPAQRAAIQAAIEALAPNLAEDAHKFYRALHGILGPTIPGMIK